MGYLWDWCFVMYVYIITLVCYMINNAKNYIFIPKLSHMNIAVAVSTYLAISKVCWDCQVIIIKYITSTKLSFNLFNFYIWADNGERIATSSCANRCFKKHQERFCENIGRLCWFGVRVCWPAIAPISGTYQQ